MTASEQVEAVEADVNWTVNDCYVWRTVYEGRYMVIHVRTTTVCSC
jgi:hypothetical protein